MTKHMPLSYIREHIDDPTPNALPRSLRHSPYFWNRLKIMALAAFCYAAPKLFEAMK